MADRLKGITIEIGGDTTKLSKALSSVNKEIKSTQSDLKDVERLLKMDPGNMDLLKQKQQLLADAVKETKEKLDALKTAQAQMDANGVDKNSEAYQRLKREIIETESQLKKAKDALANFNIAGEKLKNVGDNIKGLGNSLAPISAMAGAVVGGLSKIAYDSVTLADDLNTLSKQTGLSTDDLQKMKYASDLVDVSLNDIVGSLKKLKNNMDSASPSVVAAFDEIGVSTTNLDGSMRNVDEVFYEVLQGLSNIENETERDLIAMDLFGKSADSLAGIIDDGGESLSEYGKQAEELGLILSSDTLNSLNEVNDAIDEGKAIMMGSVAELGATIAEQFAPQIKELGEFIKTISENLKEMNPETIKIIAQIAAVIAVIAPLLILVGNVIAAIGSIISGIGSFITICGTVVSVLGGPVTLAIGAIIAIIVVLIAHWEQVKETVEKAVAIIRENIEAFKKDAVEKFEEVKNKVTEFVTNMLSSVTENVTKIKDTIVEKFGEAVKFIEELPGKALTWGKDLIQNFVDGIMEKWNSLKETVSSIAEGIKDFIGFSEPKKGPLSKFHTFAPDMMELYAKGINENKGLVTNAVAGVAGNVAALMNRGTTANINLTSTLNLDGNVIAETVNRELGVML